MSLQICTVAGIYLRWIIRIYCVLNPYVMYCKEKKKTSVFSNSIQILFSHLLLCPSVWCVHGESEVGLWCLPLFLSTLLFWDRVSCLIWSPVVGCTGCSASSQVLPQLAFYVTAWDLSQILMLSREHSTRQASPSLAFKFWSLTLCPFTSGNREAFWVFFFPKYEKKMEGFFCQSW